MATGQFTRRRIRPGYLSCGICDRDLPEEEFRDIKRTYGGREKRYRNTYCRGCESAMNTAEEKRKRQDPTHHERAKRRQRACYRRNGGATRWSNREFRLQQTQRAIDRLMAAGWTAPTIGKAIDAKPSSIHRWRRGEGAPFARHAESLRFLAGQIEREARAA